MKKTIWVVDDDSIFKIIIKKLIAKFENFENVVTFSNGEEALESLNQIIQTNEKPPDIILLDIEMPLMDGWEFMNQIDHLKDYFKNNPLNIFILSSSIAFEDKLKAEKNENVTGYITKPITLEDLSKVVS